jgi:hypothetical protein
MALRDRHGRLDLRDQAGDSSCDWIFMEEVLGLDGVRIAVGELRL